MTDNAGPDKRKFNTIIGYVPQKLFPKQTKQIFRNVENESTSNIYRRTSYANISNDTYDKIDHDYIKCHCITMYVLDFRLTGLLKTDNNVQNH